MPAFDFTNAETSRQTFIAFNRFNHQVTLLYRKTVTEPTSFQFCVDLSSGIAGTVRASPDFYQWGYKIYGTGYEVTTDQNQF